MIENKMIIYSVFIPLVVILFFIFLFISYRKGGNNKTFTIRTTSIFVVFSGLSIALSYWSITIIPHVLSFSFSTIAVMYVGFLLGPKEGFIFGLFTDTIKSLIKGYPWMFVYALTEPIMGLISGYVGLNKDKYKSRKYKIALMIFVQIFFLLLFILSMTLINVQDVFGAKEWGGVIYIDDTIRRIINIVVPIVYIFFEAIYVFLYFKKDEKWFTNLNISLLIVMIISIVTSFGLNSIAAQIYYGTPYYLSALSRVFSSPIFLPIQASILFSFINLTDYADWILTHENDKW